MGWSLLLNWRVWALLAYAGLSGAVWLQTHRLATAKASLEALRGEYEVFQAKVRAEGEVALEAAKRVRATQIRTLTETRGNYATETAALHRHYQSVGLSDCAPGPRGGGVSSPDPNPGRTDATSPKPETAGLLERCAQDALTLTRLQDLLRKNGHTVVQ
jgi:hypothetical protein